MRKRVAQYLLTVLGIGVAVATGFLFIFMRPLPVEVAQPVEGTAVQVFGLGTVEARIISKIGFEVGAALIELNVDHGERVRKGDVLARLHSGEQQARVAKADAGVVNAEAALKRAQAAVVKTGAVLAQKRLTNERKQTLLSRQSLSVESADESQMEVDVAGAELAVAASDVDVARAALKNAEAQYQLETVLLDHHVLKAPYNAIVVERHKELGSVLAPGEALFTLVAPETVWTLAYVDEARAGDIQVGQPADLRLRSLPRQVFQGHVARIAIESDRVSEERRVYIACDRCPERFHLGEQAEVLIRTAVLDEALLVPETAVESFDGTKGVVWAVEDGELHRREVAFGKKTLDSRLEISRGLPAGAQVVTTLLPGLREGRAAKVTEKAAP